MQRERFKILLIHPPLHPLDRRRSCRLSGAEFVPHKGWRTSRLGKEVECGSGEAIETHNSTMEWLAISLSTKACKAQQDHHVTSSAGMQCSAGLQRPATMATKALRCVGYLHTGLRLRHFARHARRDLPGRITMLDCYRPETVDAGEPSDLTRRSQHFCGVIHSEKDVLGPREASTWHALHGSLMA